MCGICGKISFDSHGVIDSGLISKMAFALRHRGPNMEGIYVNGNVGLGHRRLSIIDLSDNGKQPMHNEDSTVWVVCNGEIYNFKELRIRLEGKGHRFQSQTDTEVIIHLYEEMSVDCVKELRGMFAFAVWDQKRQRLLLARDRLGKKPLNYAVKNENLIFGSEIKSILQDPDFQRKVNVGAMHNYLSYMCVPYPDTIFEEIKKLPPAHILIFEKGDIKIERYWNLKFSNKRHMDEKEYSSRVLEHLAEATKIRLVSDVPLGVFLSGGIDSSIVVAMMSRFSNSPVRTFSIGFEEASFNELKYARVIAERFNTKHHEYIVKPDAVKILPKLVWHFNEPFADSSALPTYYLSAMARNEVTVALNGDGGDESFAGYERYIANNFVKYYRMLPLAFRAEINCILTKLPDSSQKRDYIRFFRVFAGGALLSKEEMYAKWMSVFNNELKDDIYSEDLRCQLKNLNSYDYLTDKLKESDTDNLIDATLFCDIMTYLPNDLLVKVDIASMANSLEVRSPFLDHKLVEFAASIPANLKLRGITTKYILKKAFAGILPKEILYRPKAGFGIPLGFWFRKDLRNYAYGILQDNAFLKRGYFRKAAIAKLLKEHSSGKIDHGHRIWSLLNLELWHRMFIDGTLAYTDG